MAHARRTAIALSLGLVIGALVGALAVGLRVSKARYHGIPAPLFDQTYFYNHGERTLLQPGF